MPEVLQNSPYLESFYMIIRICFIAGRVKMADDFDVEALLEAPFKKEVNGEREVITVY